MLIKDAHIGFYIYLFKGATVTEEVAFFYNLYTYINHIYKESVGESGKCVRRWLRGRRRTSEG